MKKLIYLFLVLILLPWVPLNAQVLDPSNIYTATRGLERSDWDNTYFPSYSSDIRQNFIFVPFSASEIWQMNHYTGGTSFVIGPFRVFFLGDLIFNTDRFMTETESYNYQDNLIIDSDGNGIFDTYQETYNFDYDYTRNSWGQGIIFLSPGLALILGPLTGGARYLYQIFNNNNINFEVTSLETEVVPQLASNNVATALDKEVSLSIHDSGMVNGLAAGAGIDFGFLRLHGDLFASIQNIGRYDLSLTERTHLLNNIAALDGTTQDYVTTVTSQGIENGFLNFGTLVGGSTIFTPNINQRFEYAPSDPTGEGFTLPASINAPQVITDINLNAEGELFGFIVPFNTGIRSSSLTRDSFKYNNEVTNYVSASQESNHTETTDTLSLSSDGNNAFYTSLGILKRFYGNPLSFQIGAEYKITSGKYNIKVTRKLETLTQVDNSAPGDGDYVDTGVDTNTTQVQDVWYKVRDFSMVSSTFIFPLNFLFNITRNFEFFGGALFSYELGKQKTAYLNTGEYKADQTTNNNTQAVTVVKENYTTEPVLVYTVSSINNLSVSFAFGLRYFFAENLIFTTELLTAEPTVSAGAGSLFANTLIAEVDYRFGKKREK